MLEQNRYHVLGVMSGTSLDGVDIAEVFLDYSISGWVFSFGKTKTYAYSEEWKKRLKNAVLLTDEQISRLDTQYTRLLSELINTFILEKSIKNIDFVCSHGHTVFHQPEKGFTLQIGNSPTLAKAINQTVICDFRKQDIALGGQGAPLVPIGDELLFNEYDYCLNLGGFANVSFKQNEKRIAYDICPANIVLNSFAQKLGFDYDNKGSLAQKGTVNKTILRELNKLPYYTTQPPKSLGIEWVEKNIMPVLTNSTASVYDKLCTLTEHIAQNIAEVFKTQTKVLVTGGGAYNAYLLERIKFYKKVKIIVPERTLIEFKESLIFALLGVLKMRNEINCLSSVTGARKDHSSGKIFLNKP